MLNSDMSLLHAFVNSATNVPWHALELLKQLEGESEEFLEADTAIANVLLRYDGPFSQRKVYQYLRSQDWTKEKPRVTRSIRMTLG